MCIPTDDFGSLNVAEIGSTYFLGPAVTEVLPHDTSLRNIQISNEILPLCHGEVFAKFLSSLAYSGPSRQT